MLAIGRTIKRVVKGLFRGPSFPRIEIERTRCHEPTFTAGLF